MSLQDDDEDIIAKLKALPPQGQEPDWQKLEAAIRAQVGDRAPPGAWWRNWKWIVPIWALATTTAVALIVLRTHHDEPPPKHAVTLPHRDPAPPTRTVTNAPTMWLDGEAVNVDELDDTSLDVLDQAAREALGPDEVSLEDLDDAALDRLEDWLDKERS
jgi:hypothetical protein